MTATVGTACCWVHCWTEASSLRRCSIPYAAAPIAATRASRPHRRRCRGGGEAGGAVASWGSLPDDAIEILSAGGLGVGRRLRRVFRPAIAPMQLTEE